MEDQFKYIETIGQYLPEAEKRGIRLNDKGLVKLQEARESGIGEFPEWFLEDMKNARDEIEQKTKKHSDTI